MADTEGITMHSNPRTRILVVDDEQVLRRMLDRVLTARGFEVRTSVDGHEAMAMLKAERFDVVLSDMVMPKCDGRCLLEAMRDAGITTPVVMLTGYTDVSDWSLRALGAIAVLGKPSPVDTICTTLESARHR
jgi:DNA-binding NtrC family response regulator